MYAYDEYNITNNTSRAHNFGVSWALHGFGVSVHVGQATRLTCVRHRHKTLFRASIPHNFLVIVGMNNYICLEMNSVEEKNKVRTMYLN